MPWVMAGGWSGCIRLILLVVGSRWHPQAEPGELGPYGGQAELRDTAVGVTAHPGPGRHWEPSSHGPGAPGVAVSRPREAKSRLEMGWPSTEGPGQVWDQLPAACCLSGS